MTDRQKAERAIGRKLTKDEHVHHHSKTQLVICDREYHQWLHYQMRMRGIPTPRMSSKPGMYWVRLHPETAAKLLIKARATGRSRASYMSWLCEQEVLRHKEAAK